MNRPARIAFGVASAALIVWMIVLYTRSARITEENSGGPNVQVSCGSVAAAGWPWDGGVLADEGGSFVSDHISSGPSISEAGYAGIARDCSDRREMYVGTMALLAVPATLFGAGAMFAGVRRGDSVAAPVAP